MLYYHFAISTSRKVQFEIQTCFSDRIRQNFETRIRIQLFFLLLDSIEHYFERVKFPFISRFRFEFNQSLKQLTILKSRDYHANRASKKILSVHLDLRHEQKEPARDVEEEDEESHHGYQIIIVITIALYDPVCPSLTHNFTELKNRIRIQPDRITAILFLFNIFFINTVMMTK